MDEEKRISRGCFFCKSGKEIDVVRQFEMRFPGGRAVAPTKSRYRRAKDVVIEEKVPLLPGYVFFEMNDSATGGLISEPAADKNNGETPQFALQTFSRIDSVLKLLRYSDGDWRLQGDDDKFAMLLFETGGNIGISQAYFDVGNRIRILDGFLKDYEGSITRVNRKNRTVEVQVDLPGKKVSMKLGYELVEGIGSSDNKDSVTGGTGP